MELIPIMDPQDLWLPQDYLAHITKVGLDGQHLNLNSHWPKEA